MEYAEMFSKLTYETAIVTFFKKNGDIRIMLCTRNLSTISLLHGFKGQELGGHDTRCNIKNGNLAVIDLILGEARSFSKDRVIDIHFCGILNSVDEVNKVISQYKEFKEEYEKTKPMKLDMEYIN